MRTGINRERMSVLALIATLCVGIVLLYSADALSSTYNDNTTVESKLNVSNVAPHITDMVFYKDGQPSINNIVLEEGTTINVRCNGTVNDTNGIADIATVNGTIYKYGVTDADDNNSHYTNASCLEVSLLDNLAAYYTCNFEVEYYADNGTWTCNMSAGDTGELKNSTIVTNDIDPLYALNLSNTTIDFGELKPNEASGSDTIMNVTNTGNMNLTIALRAYGAHEGDDWAMNCTVGNISLAYERYDVASAQAWASMTSVANTFTDIAGLEVHQRVSESDTETFSTNNTYWKIKAPFGTRGFCNGTVEFSAKKA